jgi:uncharacterized membrane protein
VSHVLVRLGVILLVVYVPAQSVGKRADELMVKLGFVVLAGPIGIAVAVKPLYQFKNFSRNRHSPGTPQPLGTVWRGF